MIEKIRLESEDFECEAEEPGLRTAAPSLTVESTSGASCPDSSLCQLISITVLLASTVSKINVPGTKYFYCSFYPTRIVLCPTDRYGKFMLLIVV